MPAALIGHTGFVGSNLLTQTDFSHRFHRANIATIAEQSYDLVVCAGVQATKWWANKNPDEDRQGIEALKKNLKNVKTERFVLLSTIDVYENSHSQTDEATPPPPGIQPYGAHRLALEAWVRESFSNTLIVRLPALFGPGLKKNIIFDLLTDNQTDKIIPNTTFQWYDLRNLWRDIGIAEKAKLDLIHLMPEPLATQKIIDTCFATCAVGAPQTAPASYDICTRHAALFGASGRYIQTSGQSMADLKNFVEGVRAGHIKLGGGIPS